MSNVDYEYRGMIASSWDLLRGDTSNYPDRGFFRDLIKRNGEPALIVGCGTGRLLLEYLADGIDVEGVDVSPEMLAICQRKADQEYLAVKLYTQSMEMLDLPRRYRTIAVPSASFQLVTEMDHAMRALVRFHQHLQPGGILVISIWHIISEDSSGWGQWRLVAEEERLDDGKTIRRWERSKYEKKSQLRYTENSYELLEDDVVVFTEEHARSPEMRDYNPAQLSEMFRKAGYTSIHAISGFSSQPATEKDEVFVILGKKVGD
jgi:ubiquinone/menaquinone biosynthesis C-methylase UbiE